MYLCQSMSVLIYRMGNCFQEDSKNYFKNKGINGGKLKNICYGTRNVAKLTIYDLQWRSGTSNSGTIK